MHPREPVAPVSRRAEAWIAQILAVPEGNYVGAILCDPCGYLIGCADGPVTRCEDIDFTGRALKLRERDEIVLKRVSGVEVKHWDQDIGQHVAGDEHAALLDEQRRVARRVGLMFDDLYIRAIWVVLTGRPVTWPSRSSGTRSSSSGGMSPDPAMRAFAPGADSQARTAAAQREVAYRGAVPSSASQSR